MLYVSPTFPSLKYSKRVVSQMIWDSMFWSQSSHPWNWQGCPICWSLKLIISLVARHKRRSPDQVTSQGHVGQMAISLLLVIIHVNDNILSRTIRKSFLCHRTLPWFPLFHWLGMTSRWVSIHWVTYNNVTGMSFCYFYLCNWASCLVCAKHVPRFDNTPWSEQMLLASQRWISTPAM